MPLDATAIIVETGSGLPLSLSLVVPLLKRRSPSAIARFVVAVIIRPAINRVTGRRARPYISQEIGKRVQPPIAYLDAPATVITPSAIIGVSAAMFHGSPSIIFRPPPPSPMSVSCVSHNCFFQLKASATLCGSAVKMVASYFFNGAALALAKPHSAARFAVAHDTRGSLFNNCPSVKRSSSETVVLKRVDADQMFPLEATATLDVAALKRSVTDFLNGSALAPAKPNSLGFDGWPWLNNRKSAINHSNGRYSSLHWGQYKEISSKVQQMCGEAKG